MRSLQTHLEHWVAAHLISTEQAANITAFEAQKHRKPWLLMAFMLFGVLLVGIGIISIIAANWDKIPPTTKLSANMAALIATAGCAVWFRVKEQRLAAEGALFLFMALCMASIGLVAQVYHTSGTFYMALLVWCGMTVGVASLSRVVLPPLLWWTAFVLGSLGWLAEHTAWEAAPEYLALLTPLGLALLSFIYWRWRTPSPETPPQARALYALSGVAVLGSFCALDLWGGHSINPALPVFFLPWVYSLSAVLLAVLFSVRTRNKTSATLSAGILGLYLANLHVALFMVDAPWLSSVLAVVSLLTLALLAANFDAKRLFQFLFIIACFRCIILYWEAFGGLMATGIGFIFSGILVLLAVYLLHKYWHNMNAHVESWVK